MISARQKEISSAYFSTEGSSCPNYSVFGAICCFSRRPSPIAHARLFQTGREREICESSSRSAGKTYHLIGRQRLAEILGKFSISWLTFDWYFPASSSGFFSELDHFSVFTSSSRFEVWNYVVIFVIIHVHYVMPIRYTFIVPRRGGLSWRNSGRFFAWSADSFSLSRNDQTRAWVHQNGSNFLRSASSSLRPRFWGFGALGPILKNFIIKSS